VVPRLLLEARYSFFVHYFDTLLREASLSLTHSNPIYCNDQSGKPAKFDRRLSRYSLALFRDCLPIKLRAIHICLPQMKNPPFLFTIPIIKFMAGKRLRRRMVLHSGCEHFVVMGLIKYGLSRSIIPMEVGGDYYWQPCHAEWLANRLFVERRREETLER
jgi:hypothetical protein